MQVPLAHGAVPAARYKPGIVIEPLNAPDLARVVLERVLRGALSRIELVHRYGVLVGACEEVPSVGEPDLAAQLDADLLELLETALEDVHHAHLVREAHDDVEA